MGRHWNYSNRVKERILIATAEILAQSPLSPNSISGTFRNFSGGIRPVALQCKASRVSAADAAFPVLTVSAAAQPLDVCLPHTKRCKRGPLGLKTLPWTCFPQRPPTPNRFGKADVSQNLAPQVATQGMVHLEIPKCRHTSGQLPKSSPSSTKENRLGLRAKKENHLFGGPYFDAYPIVLCKSNLEPTFMRNLPLQTPCLGSK